MQPRRGAHRDALWRVGQGPINARIGLPREALIRPLRPCRSLYRSGIVRIAFGNLYVDGWIRGIMEARAAMVWVSHDSLSERGVHVTRGRKDNLLVIYVSASIIAAWEFGQFIGRVIAS